MAVLAGPPPLVIDVTRVARANNWTYFLIAANVIILIAFGFMIYAFIKIAPKTGLILREFMYSVFND